VDIWSDDDLDRLEQRVDYVLHTEDDGRTLIVSPQAIKDLITAFRHLRTENGAGAEARSTVNGTPTEAPPTATGRAAEEARSVSRSAGAGRPRA